MTIKCSAGSTDDAQMCFKATDSHEQMKLESREDEEVIFNDATSDNLQQWGNSLHRLLQGKKSYTCVCV